MKQVYLSAPLVARSSIQGYNADLHKAFLTDLYKLEHKVTGMYAMAPNLVPKQLRFVENHAPANSTNNAMVSDHPLSTPTCNVPGSHRTLLYDPAIDHGWGMGTHLSSNNALACILAATNPSHHYACICLLLSSPVVEINLIFFVIIFTHALNSNLSSPPCQAFPGEYQVPIVLSSEPLPMCPAIKHAKVHHRPNVFVDSTGFPDNSAKFNIFLHNVDVGCILCHLKYEDCLLNGIDLSFNIAYDASKHSAKFNADFKPSPWLSAADDAWVAALIQKYWAIFDDTGLLIPI